MYVLQYMLFMHCFSKSESTGSSVVQRWPSDLAIVGLFPAEGKHLYHRDSTADKLSLSPSHLPDMTEILVKRTFSLKSSVHLSGMRPQLFLLYSLIIHSSMNFFSQHSRQFILSFFQVFEA